MKVFEKYNVHYLVVGGYAVMKYSEPRFTKDLGLFISADKENGKGVYSALKEFGAPLENLSPEDFSQEGYFYQMGRAPLRVDIMMSIPGVEFNDIWPRRETVDLGGVPVNFISLSDLIKSKAASGRPQDLVDLEKLKISEPPVGPDNP